MISREQLVNKNVVFRLADTKHVYPGTGVAVESEGFWLESVEMLNQLRGDMSWGYAVREFAHPLMFIPDAGLMFLMVEKSVAIEPETP